MNVCAMTERQESTDGVLLMSKMKSGFLMKLTQNLSGKLKKKHKLEKYEYKIMEKFNKIPRML